MKLKKIKKMLFVIFLFVHIFCMFSFAKTIDLNGINISLNVNANKKQVGKGFNVKNDNKFSDTEYEKEEKEADDESVSVELKIKNANPYEACNVTIIEKINGGFKQSGNIKNDKTINLKLSPNEEKTYKYNYKYNENFLKDQFNEFLFGDKDKVVYDDEGNIITDREKAKEYLLEKSKKGISDKENINIKDKESRKNKNSYKWIFVIFISFFVVILVGVLFYIFFIRVKDHDNQYDDSHFSKYNDFDGFNIIAVTIILSLIVSLCFNNRVFALEYTPIVYEKGQNFTKVVTETIVFNERYYDFTYEIKVKFENKNEITDYTIDSDSDGLVDALEYLYMTDINNPDTDGDGLSDYYEVMVLNYNPRSKWTFDDGRNDGYRDYDGDGLRNIKELEYGTDMTLFDTDGDNLSDFEEINGVKNKNGSETYITDPLNKDTDDDGLNDDVEIKLGLDPTNPMTDGFTPDSERKVEQEYNMTLVPSNLLEGDILISTIKSNRAGDIDESIKVTNYYNQNLDNVNSLVSSTFEITSDSDDKIDIELDVSKVSERKTKLTVVKYIDGTFEPVETVLKGDTLEANIDSNGIYGVVDSEIVLRDLSIFIDDYR